MSGRIQLIPNGRTYETAIYMSGWTWSRAQPVFDEIHIYLFILLWVWGKKKIKAPQEDKISYVPRIRLGDLAR